jgi:hypothetical protein
MDLMIKNAVKFLWLCIHHFFSSVYYTETSQNNFMKTSTRTNDVFSGGSMGSRSPAVRPLNRRPHYGIIFVV